jgi:hypothetical protein
MAIRVKHWKVTFKEQNHEIGPKTPMGVWQGDFTNLRAPKIYNMRSDPFERGRKHQLQQLHHGPRMFLIVPAQAIAAKWLESFKDFPPRQKPASFSLADVMEKMETARPNQN